MDINKWINPNPKLILRELPILHLYPGFIIFEAAHFGPFLFAFGFLLSTTLQRPWQHSLIQTQIKLKGLEMNSSIVTKSVLKMAKEFLPFEKDFQKWVSPQICIVVWKVLHFHSVALAFFLRLHLYPPSTKIRTNFFPHSSNFILLPV